MQQFGDVQFFMQPYECSGELCFERLGRVQHKLRHGYANAYGYDSGVMWRDGMRHIDSSMYR